MYPAVNIYLSANGYGASRITDLQAEENEYVRDQIKGLKDFSFTGFAQQSSTSRATKISKTC